MHLACAIVEARFLSTSEIKIKMKITVVTTLSVDRFNYVKVETDEGLVRIRELHPASSTGGTPALIDHLPSLKSGGDTPLLPLPYKLYATFNDLS